MLKNVCEGIVKIRIYYKELKLAFREIINFNIKSDTDEFHFQRYIYILYTFIKNQFDYALFCIEIEKENSKGLDQKECKKYFAKIAEIDFFNFKQINV